ncbi:MAG: glycosyltransferase, partial [bacterium]
MSMDLSDTVIRKQARKQIQQLGEIDLLLGVPSYNNEATVKTVLERVSRGAREHYPELNTLVMLSDGDSEDDTRERARSATIPEGTERIVTVYEGIPGKGSAFRTIFETAACLDVDYCMVVDADLRTELESWVDKHLKPIIEDGNDYQTPNYARHKHDGTITNNVCFPMTAALYGTKVRQPIGGDFALSGDLATFYAGEEEWDTHVARFGIDIWMTTCAICEGFDIGQTNLGAKIHDPKDPGESLGPMFREVVGTLFRMMKKYQDQWKSSSGINEAPVYGEPLTVEPEPVPVDRDGLRKRALRGWEDNRELYSQILQDGTYRQLEKQMTNNDGELYTGDIDATLWYHMLFEYSVAYNFSDYD